MPMASAKSTSALHDSSTKGAEYTAGPAPDAGSTPPVTESIPAIHVFTCMLIQVATHAPQQKQRNHTCRCRVLNRSRKIKIADHTAAVGHA